MTGNQTPSTRSLEAGLRGKVEPCAGEPVAVVTLRQYFSD